MSTCVKITLKLKSTTSTMPIEPPTRWLCQFRQTPKIYVQSWFWSNFDWTKMSVWIGKLNQLNNLPKNTNEFLKRIIDDLKSLGLDQSLFVKFYHCRNVWVKCNEVNCMIICDRPTLPEGYSETLLGVMFETYQLTKDLIDIDSDFQRLLDHYLTWNGFYGNATLLETIEN